jgi:hypothetical protein
MQSRVLLKCKLRRHFGSVASHNLALRIISDLGIATATDLPAFPNAAP